MKATLFAVVLSSVILSLPAHAGIKNTPPIASSTPKQAITKIDLNKADVQILNQSFKGIGQKRAEAIIKYRDTNGRFKSVEELAQVRGIGKQFVSSHLAQLNDVFTTE